MMLFAIATLRDVSFSTLKTLIFLIIFTITELSLFAI